MMISLTFLHRIKNSFPAYTVKLINHGTTFELQSGTNIPIVFIPTVFQSEIENFTNLTLLLQNYIVSAISTDITTAINQNYFVIPPPSITTVQYSTKIYGNKLPGDTIIIQ